MTISTGLGLAPFLTSTAIGSSSEEEQEEEEDEGRGSTLGGRREKKGCWRPFEQEDSRREMEGSTICRMRSSNANERL
jgi:hypothetical protein